jgi:glyoxylase-like metal-dependent hydrolase (beta-lactamase superfamily II)
MFGTVPKVLWNRLMPADGDNRILMATNCLLLRGEAGGRSHAVLVDNGNGDKETEAWMSRFDMEGTGVLDRDLARFGLAPKDITLSLLTHLHFDHAGGTTRLEGEDVVPSFPNARHVVQGRDLEDARHPNLRVKASYVPRNWEPVVQAGLLDTVDGPAEILPGLSVRPIPGHVAGLQGIVVEGEGKKLMFLADLFPTSRHIQPAWCMGYDLDVVTCVESRLGILEEVADTDTVLVFEHDPDVPSGTVRRNDKGGYEVVPRPLND